MIDEVVKDGYIKLSDYEQKLIDFFGTDEVVVMDVLDALMDQIAKNEELERKIEEDYIQKDVDYYQEYGINEEDFH